MKKIGLSSPKLGFNEVIEEDFIRNKSMRNEDLNVIPVELNLIEHSIFVGGGGIKRPEFKHFVSDKNDSFVKIEATSELENPGEFDQKVFFALIKLMKENSYSRKFIVSLSEILLSLGETNKSYYTRIKKSLRVLSESTFTFKNCFYSNKQRGILNEEVRFQLINLVVIKNDNSNGSISQFEDKRTKEVYEISIAEKIHENIVSKGFLAVNLENLSALDYISKKLYLILEKWRNYENTVERPVYTIASKLSLSLEKKNLARTIKIIEKSVNHLKENNLLKDFNINKGKTFEKTTLKVIYDECHNKNRQNNITKENRYRYEMDINTNEIKNSKTAENEDKINEILMLYPKETQELSSLFEIISEAINKYGFEYVKDTVEYVVKKTPDYYKSYTVKALKENWAEEYRNKKQNKAKRKSSNLNKNESQTKPIEEKVIEKSILKFDDFPNLTDKEKEETEEKAYRKFLNATGNQDSKCNRNIFKKVKASFISNELYVLKSA